MNAVTPTMPNHAEKLIEAVSNRLHGCIDILTLLRGFIRLPRGRQLTFMRYCLEAYAAKVTPDGAVSRGMCSEMAGMDSAWAQKARRATRRRMRERLFVVPNLGDGPDDPAEGTEEPA